MKKLDNIATGEVFKNYSALCTALDEPQKTGKSKQLQLLDWQRYFAYEKQGHKFIITEIFEEPKEKVKKQNTKYTSNNRINIQSMIDLLQSNLDYTKGQFYSYSLAIIHTDIIFTMVGVPLENLILLQTS